jgi:hypothetical protein
LRLQSLDSGGSVWRAKISSHRQAGTPQTTTDACGPVFRKIYLRVPDFHKGLAVAVLLFVIVVFNFRAFTAADYGIHSFLVLRSTGCTVIMESPIK